MHSATLRARALAALRSGLSHGFVPVRTASAIVLAGLDDPVSRPMLDALVLGLGKDGAAIETLRAALAKPPSDRSVAIDALREGVHHDDDWVRGLSAALLLEAGQPVTSDLVDLAFIAINTEPCMRALQRLVAKPASRQMVLDRARHEAQRPLPDHLGRRWLVAALRLNGGEPATLALVVPLVEALSLANFDHEGSPAASLRRALTTEARPALLFSTAPLPQAPTRRPDARGVRGPT